MKIGVAGQIGSGKSEVCKVFASLGARVISADRLGWDLLAPGSHAYRRLVHVFGREILGPGGQIDRRTLGLIVFSSRRARLHLNRITHPELLRRLRAEAEERRPGEVVVIDAALLIDWGLDREMDAVVIVTAPRAAKIRRLVHAGYSTLEAQDRLESQRPESELCLRADVVISNRGTLAELRVRCRRLWPRILAAAERRARPRA